MISGTDSTSVGGGVDSKSTSVTKLGKASKEQSALGHIAWPAVVIRVTAFKEKLMFALPPPGVAAEITGCNSSSPPLG